MGSQYGDFPDNSINGYQPINGIMMSPGYDESLNYANLFNYKDPSQDLTSLNLPAPFSDSYPSNLSSGLGPGPGQGVELSDDSDSDDVLKYISQLLMEEDIEQKPCMFYDALALQAAEKPLYDALGQKYPHSPNQHPLIDHGIDSPDDHPFSSTSESSVSTCSSSSYSTNYVDPAMVAELSDNNNPLITRPPIVGSQSQSSTIPQWSFESLSSVNGTPTFNGSTMSGFGFQTGADFFSQEDSILQFQKGMEEASKFLPKNNNIVIDLENINFPNPIKDDSFGFVVKKEKDEISPNESRGSKIHYREDEDFDEGRSSKQSAVSIDEVELSDMFDRVLLCNPQNCDNYPKSGKDQVQNPQSSQSKGPEGGKGRPRKQDNSKNVVDLRTLLVLCAQSTASDDRRTANELLKQIREHSSANGDGSQRLAHYFANALEARLAGTGSQIYTALNSKRTTAADMLKAYQFFIRTCPIKKVSIRFANCTIYDKVAEKAPKIHVIDFGILYGFQWPVLIQQLSNRPGERPELLRITGIDLPQPGFRPAERVEATGRRLAKYCERFKIPFEFHAIAQKWETIKVEDLTLKSDEVVVVNCLYRFKNLLDETIVVDSPRNAVLNLVRDIKPDLFVHGVVNGSYNAPFFVTRFREALFHYSTLFDIFDTNAPREDPERFMFEKEFYRREIMNVVACEGTERVERPETYKQWQVRNNRAGFKQLPLDQELIDDLRKKVKTNYHRDFVIDVDGHWTLHGWKGRITHAISAWVPA